ncbi:hypothetical protein AAIA72_08505 [Hahella sp. SMD15-11]|uniref:Uncharacterized protein n=1 Tax=Thermohahella caldifontis TaxID=3142973 RepID=A0AB39URA3_9GAMM
MLALIRLVYGDCAGRLDHHFGSKEGIGAALFIGGLEDYACLAVRA